MTDNDLLTAKEMVGSLLLDINGVVGVGIGNYDDSGTPDRKLVVMLAADSDELRKHIAAVVQKNAPNAPVGFLVTGHFKAH